jgi:UDP-glucose 4-epimerase
MRVLIVGGAGFIGSHLTELLVERGHTVTVLDDMSSGSRENLQHTEARVFTAGTETPQLAGLVKGVDAIVHLAAAVGVDRAVYAPVRTITQNVNATAAVLARAADAGVPVVLASSSEVYGDQPAPQREDTPIQIGSAVRWGYACAKALDEQLAAAYRSERGLSVTVARLFNTVGPRQSARYGMVVPRFVSQALAGEPLTVYGDGWQSRCFCHVKDVALALALLVEQQPGGVFNVGSTTETIILGLAHEVIERTDSASTIREVPYAEVYGEGFEDVCRRVPDTAKIRALGWGPTRTLGEIIDDVASVQVAA